MKVVQIKLADLKRPKRNVRMHTQKQIDEYCRSVKKFGQIRPMVIDEDNVILVGNGLYDALLQLGWETGSCMVEKGLSENEKKKLMLADNRIFSLGVDDMAAFDEIIAELGGDFDVPGYDDALLNSLIAEIGDIDEVMAGYGIVSDDDKEAMQKAGDQYKRNEETFAATAEEIKPQQQPAADVAARPQEAPQGAFEDTDNKTTPPTTENTTESPAEPLQHKYIVCPKCSEKIWL